MRDAQLEKIWNPTAEGASMIPAEFQCPEALLNTERESQLTLISGLAPNPWDRAELGWFIPMTSSKTLPGERLHQTVVSMATKGDRFPCASPPEV